MAKQNDNDWALCRQTAKQEEGTIPAGYCSRNWDKILCWPPAPPGTMAIQPCFEEFHGLLYDATENVTRWCNETGHWNKTNYDGCKELEHVDLSDKIFLCGYLLSLITLTIAAIIFQSYRELRCLRNTIHTNLMCTYILASIMWITLWIMNQSWQYPEWLCNVLVITWSFATLTNFFWMFVEGLFLYMLVVQTFTIENIRLRAYVIIGWVIPGVITLTWMAAKAIVQKSESTSGKPCPWMEQGLVDWIYKVPAIITLALNCIFLAKIMWVLITKLRSANTVETQQYRKAAKALLVLFPLLGITYMLTIIVPDHGVVTMYIRYVRDGFLSTQGFLVSIFYCFCNSEVRSVLRHSFRVFCEKRQIGNKRQRFPGGKESSFVGCENVRLFGNQDGSHAHYVKRESGASDMTTVTYVGYSSSSNGRCRSLSGSAGGAMSGSMKATILTTPSLNCV